MGDDMGLTNTQKTECSHGEAEPRLVIPRCGVHVCVCVCVCCVCVYMRRRLMDAGQSQEGFRLQPEPS